MKTETVVALIAVLISTATAAVVFERESSANRFQIVAGTHDSSATMFKVDQSTGQTWMLIDVGGGGNAFGWIELPDIPTKMKLPVINTATGDSPTAGK